jgi:hypothetical protein
MSDRIKQGYILAKERGVRIRYVTEVTPENLEHCKELVKFVELRHLASVKGSFAVSEGEFVAGILGSGGTLSRIVYSDDRDLVSSQQDVFETMWANATPARARMARL